MATLHVLRVFTTEEGSGGNPLGVFLDGAAVPRDRRQAVAHDLGYSETVFVDDPAHGVLQIFTPGSELPFAGHPLVGTAWLLHRTGTPVDTLRPPAGEVRVRRDAEVTWIAGRPEWASPFEFIELPSTSDVDALTGPPAGQGLPSMWAWMDESRGLIRARVFPQDDGVAEDEATGAAALRMAAMLGRAITIHQGRGSVLHAQPLGDGSAEVGGRCAFDSVRDVSL